MCLKILTHMRSEVEFIIHGIDTRPRKIIIYYMTVIYINIKIIFDCPVMYKADRKLARRFLFSLLMSQYKKEKVNKNIKLEEKRDKKCFLSRIVI